MPDIKHRVHINASAEKIYKAITTQEGISQWWTPTCIIKPEVGFTNIFDFHTHFHNEMKIVDLQENKKVVWLVLESAQEWIGTKISFEIVPYEQYIIVNFKQEGWKETDDFYADCNFNWGRYLMSLKTLCEHGKGNPYSYPEM